MDKKTKAGPKTAEITGKVVALLQSLESEDRRKVISASLTLLGETSTTPARNPGATESERSDQNVGDLPGGWPTLPRGTGLHLSTLETRGVPHPSVCEGCGF